MDAGSQDITDYFARPLNGTKSHGGQPSGWLHIGSLAIRSGILSIGDAVLFPSDQLALELKRGEYVVEVIALDFGDDRRIARLRIALPDRLATATAHSVGAISVEFAVVGVCDGRDFLDALNRACSDGKNIAQYNERYLYQLADGERPWSAITFPAAVPITMVTVSPGWGDGEYEVSQLAVGGRAIGIEVDFIPLPKDDPQV